MMDRDEQVKLDIERFASIVAELEQHAPEAGEHHQYVPLSFEAAGFRCRDATRRHRIRRAARARKARRGWR